MNRRLFILPSCRCSAGELLASAVFGWQLFGSIFTLTSMPIAEGVLGSRGLRQPVSIGILHRCWQKPKQFQSAVQQTGTGPLSGLLSTRVRPLQNTCESDDSLEGPSQKEHKQDAHDSDSATIVQ